MLQSRAAPKAENGPAGTAVSDGLAREVLDSLQDGICFATPDRRIAYWNRAAERLTGYSAEEVVGQKCCESALVHTDRDGNPLCRTECPMAAAIASATPRAARVFCLHKSGEVLPLRIRIAPVYGPERQVLGAIETLSDDAENALLREQVVRLSHEAATDPLTRLANRRTVEEALQLVFYRFERRQQLFGVVLIDLDHFKAVNDEFGHATGDAVLQAVAANLSRARRRDELVGRWGGEEFIFLAQPVGDLAQLHAAAERLRAVVGQVQITVGQQTVSVTASVGATLVRAGDNRAKLIDRADRLLFASKSAGRNRTTTA